MLAVNKQAVRSAEANRKKTKDMVEVGMTTADWHLKEPARGDAIEAESQFVVTLASLNLLLTEEPDIKRDLIGDLAKSTFRLTIRKASSA